VNDRLRAQGIRLLTDPGEDATAVGPDDVVILPAFGVSIGELARLDREGCTLVDTTCGSVLNVWKNVKRYAQDGFTSVIHGKVQHEETRATASQALQHPGGQHSSFATRPRRSLSAISFAMAATAPCSSPTSTTPSRPDSIRRATRVSAAPTRRRC
jgi:4-hydroxy-3-methylbut-2-enyl diphosphate reductase IspH